MEEKIDEATSQNVIPTFDSLAVFVSVCKGTAQDQLQYSMGQLAPQVCEHVGSGVGLIVRLVEFFDGVWELVGFD